MRVAQEYASTMPGGELSVEEQDSVIDMLEKLKERKRSAIIHYEFVHALTPCEGNSSLNSPIALQRWSPPVLRHKWRSTRMRQRLHDQRTVQFDV